MSTTNNNELTPCACCGRHFRGSDCPFCGGATEKLANSDVKSGLVTGGRTGAALVLAGALAASGCVGVVMYGGPPLSEEDLKKQRERLSSIVGSDTQRRRQAYLAYEKHTDEVNLQREKQGLQPLPKLPYKDWVKGESVTPSGAQSPTSSGE